MPKLLVLYVFHIYNDRVKHFIDNCIFKDDNTDFILISNNKDNKFIAPDYVKVLFRDNIGFDFGGWSDALLINNLYKNYDYFIFVNSSVLGPYLPSYYNGKWTDIYINGLKDNIKLFGSTINNCGDPINKAHVQSYIFSMDKNTLEYLINCEIFTMNKYLNDYFETVWQKEFKMSRKIIENNWNIGSLMNNYRNVDFTFKDKKPQDYNIEFFDDIAFSSYLNKLFTLYEVVFIKGNR